MRCAGGAHVVCGLSNFSTHVMLQWCTGGAVVPLVPGHGVGTDRRSWTGVGTWDLGFGLRLDNVVFLSILHFEMCAIIPGLAG